ncbi:succinate dehydrogenase, cytochrome b556 subunit [Halomicrococcus sp. SG-WS-1]|uniref:succinate dehydrogenase, cytochrome b556 subunit n=1 Tax=Halomicrococcus sp. SG-WS-1 TaxID=3439057 RepID=UPI003F78BB87
MTRNHDRGTVEEFDRWTEFTAGMWAWILHKFSGWILVGYLFMHVPVLSAALSGPEAYTSRLQGLETILVVRVLEVGLLAVAVFHVLNGVRLLFVDLGVGLEAQDRSFYASLVVTAVVVLASVPTFMEGAF